MKPSLLAGPLDWLMDKSLLLGYTKIGPVVRRRWWPADVAPGALVGEHVLVTGASGGLGLAAAIGIARLGATVHLVGRRHDRLVTARAAALRQVPAGRFELAECDVSDLDAVRGFCAEFAARTPRLRALVHNAGVMPPSRTTSAQGHELTLATHVLGPHLMTKLLADTLGGGRVVVVSSGGMYGQRLPTSDFEYEQGTYSGLTAYARTKRMQVALTPRWAADLGPGGVDVQAMHPGWADTPGVSDALPGFARLIGPLLRSPQQGADTVVWLAGTTERLPAGRFWCDRRPRPTHYAAPLGVESEVDRERLWEFVTAATAQVAADGSG